MTFNTDDLLIKIRDIVPTEFQYHLLIYKNIYDIYYLPIIDEIFTKLPKEIGTIADCGAGYGYWSWYLAQRGYKVTAVENEPGRLQVLRDLKQALPGLSLTVCNNDLHNLNDIGDKSYDMTFCFAVLHAVDDPAKVLSEMVRVTRKGGYICVAHSNTQHPVNQYTWRDADSIKYFFTSEFVDELLLNNCRHVFTTNSLPHDLRIRVYCGDIPLHFFAVYQKE